MKVLMFKDHDSLSRYAAQVFIDQLKANPHSVLGLATGSTPIELYQELIQANQSGEISFKDVITFNLDEYLGLPADHPESYARFMQENLFDGIDIDPANTHVPDGMAADPVLEGETYEDKISQSGGIDLQVLGLGGNAHIGFNEPDDTLSYHTHATPLTEETRQANARFFDSIDEVPSDAITMGMGSIMRAKKILLLASGEHKAEAIFQTVEGPITTQAPSSLLQLHHDVTVLIDEAAASKLNETSYEIL